MKKPGFVFDAKLMRPGCVLLQAAMGGDQYVVSEFFPPETWLVFPTPDLATYPMPTREQLKALAEKAKMAVEGTTR